MAAALTPTEREAVGKAARAKTPRSRHAFWEAGTDRPDPVETLERQDATRVPELVPIRHGRMLASAFSFYRGGAAIMAADLAATPSSGLKVQLCGDAHLSNFGGFAAPDRQLIFDINDFDETHPGPFEWDLKRLVASFSIGARELGFKASEGRSAVAAAAGQYREEMRRLASMRTIDVWYERLNVQALEQYRSQVSHSQAKNFDKNVAKAERKNSLRAFDRLTKSENGEIRIVSDPPLIVPIEEFLGVDPAVIEQRLMQVFAAYARTLDRNVRHLVDELQIRARRPQGGRGWKRGDPGVDPSAARARLAGPALPPGKGGTELRARAVHRGKPVQATGQARGRGAAPDAGGQRHLPRLGHCGRARRERSRLLRPPALGRQGLGARSRG